MNYITIKKNDLMNGVGLRTVLFVSGCHHRCPFCHNPESWAFDSGQTFTSKTMTSLLSSLDNDLTDGLTISGGDPFAPENIDQVEDICRQVRRRFPDKDIWIYTGYDFDDLKNTRIVLDRLVDVIVDGEFKNDLKDNSLHYRGSSNQHIMMLNKEDNMYYDKTSGI